MVRVAIQGDIGQQAYHVGDEAMVHAAVERSRAAASTRSSC